ncbi:MAG TPA: type 4a pilus biogenesis protein PilO [Sporichthya sp.]|nr:type 4a pilus biogenesis protein PilO [Sporichthya sp.]
MNQMQGLTPARKTAAVGTVVLLVALIAAWMLVLSPRSDAVANVNDQVTAAEQSNQTLRNQIATLQARKDQLPELREVSKALDRRFPPTAEQAKLFKMLTAAAAEAGIAPQYLTNLTVAAPAAVGSASSAQLPGVSAPITQIASQQLTLNVSGTPRQIRAFVVNLEKLPRAFAVNAISVSQSAPTATPTENASVAPDAQTVTITGNMFVMPKVVDPTASKVS